MQPNSASAKPSVRPDFSMKRKVGSTGQFQDDYVDVGPVYAKESEKGTTYYKVSKSNYYIFKDENGNLAVSKKGTDGKLSKVAELTEKMGPKTKFFSATANSIENDLVLFRVNP